ncbi:hypothetical protein QTN25_000898 [Entamoeba marina]
MSYAKNDFITQSQTLISYYKRHGRLDWSFDTRGFLIHTSQIGDELIPSSLVNSNQNNVNVKDKMKSIDENGDCNEIIEENDDIVVVHQKRYSLTHHIIYNIAYRVPQYGVLLFDNQSHKLITKLNEATTILSQYSNREAPSNDDCRNMFITLDEHPHIPDMYMFLFIHVVHHVQLHQ